MLPERDSYLSAEVVKALSEALQNLAAYIDLCQANGLENGTPLTRLTPRAVTRRNLQIIGIDAAKMERSRLLTFLGSWGVCHYGGRRAKQGFHVDHKQPKSGGGSDDPENLVVACPRHNLAKSNSTAAMFDLLVLGNRKLTNCGGYEPEARYIDEVLLELYPQDPRLSAV